jgi:hypothetical protein
MISLQDCIDLCGLDEDEVAAISEHEHIPEIAAAALASYLLKQPRGGETIRTMIIDDIHKALDEGRVRHGAELLWRCGTFWNNIQLRALDGPPSRPSSPRPLL